ncbi:meiosis protein SPO22/ZIP4 like-domain-containing protein [Irpex rosettiformis]|uniref:Meiosis protein SPO22/ZIP4 like-domain-containing protein n=1 Tax=Irpex rosettiformis TaxID=378272 RepID=A0ACB8TV57_9APHY|nr:meiosis protein SPO22/ZIP4 like-domain-containing protein [Irpex rosettiformis]
MSARKRKFEAAIKPKFESILDILIEIKPKLSDTKRNSGQPLISDLHNLAAAAESINQQRPRTSHDWLTVADTLDREGAYAYWEHPHAFALCPTFTQESIYGMPPVLSKVAQMMAPGAKLSPHVSHISPGLFQEVRRFLHCMRIHCGLLRIVRLAGFRLIEAGLEPKPSIETLIHVLQLASKAGASLSKTGRHELAAAVLTSAAKYEEQLRIVDDSEQAHQQMKSQAIILYFSSRMEAAWREGNDAVSEFMLQKITENEQRLRFLRQSDREALAAKLLEIGKIVLRNVREADDDTQKTQYHSAIKWLQKAFSLTESPSEPNEAVSQNLKHSILKSLARGYYLTSSHDPNNLDRAEATLSELIRNANMDIEPDVAEHQQLRWMRLAVLKKRNAAESELVDAFKSIIDHMRFSDGDITDILQELKALRDQHPLVVSVHRYTLQKVLETAKGSSPPHVDRLLLSLLFHCSKDIDHARAMQDIEKVLTQAKSADLELSKVPATACLTLLWQFGDRHYNAKRWGEAADWYLCGTHPVFATMARSSHAKCFRKAALCHIQGKEFSAASAVLRRCPGKEAATHYVALLCAVQQGLEDEAIRAVEDMAGAQDFDKKMLLLATQLANESDMKSLLLSVLETLLKAVQKQPDKDIHVEGLSLIRCVIRLVVKLMGEPAANSSSLVPTLLDHFNTARTLITQLQQGKAATVIAKDISWLWRTAYNCAVQGCTEWEDEETVSRLFEVARELLEIYSTSVLTENDSELSVYLANASFASVAGKIFALRKRLQKTDQQTQDAAAEVSEYIRASLRRMEVLSDNKVLTGETRERISSFIRTMHIFLAEVSCYMKDWKQTMEVIENAVRGSTTSIDTLEAIADILWVEKDCPVQVLFSGLEAILHASLDHSSLSVEKFSRWLRAICTILLSRNTQDDRTRAIRYVEQAISVLDEHPSDQQDETTVCHGKLWMSGTKFILPDLPRG